jgi:dinuclear metal center YbgI/SA1388 family protein
MQIREISDYLESIAPLSLQEEYDNSGLLIGSYEQQVESALITLDVTPEIVKEAIDKKCGLIISHHPLIFRGLKRITGQTYVEKAVALAIKNDIAVYAIHTNLDNVLKNGVNGKIAEKLGLQGVEVLSPSGDEPGRGSGVVGGLPHLHSEKEFLEHLRDSMELKMIRHTPLTGQKVQKVAVCGGSGSFLLPRAMAAGAQFFVSADFKYHDFFNAEGRIVIADIGHFESERFTMDLLADLMRIKFPTFAPHLTEKVTNPITYYPL